MTHFSLSSRDDNMRNKPFKSSLATALLAAAFTLVGSGMALAHEYKAGDLVIEHPWSRATPAGAKVAGGYFVIINNGSTPDRLVSISSDISAKSELHEMSVKDGVMTMRPVTDGLEIPAGGKAELKPGGYHLMFMGLKQQPKEGERFSATLTFEKAGAVDVKFAVEAMGMAGDHSN